MAVVSNGTAGRSAARRAVLLAVASALVAAGCGGGPRGACDPDPAPGKLGSICGFANPEDVEVIPAAGLLLVSQMRRGSDGGSIAAIAFDALPQNPPVVRRLWPSGDRARDVSALLGAGDPSCTKPPLPDAFAPHGVTSFATQTAGVVRVAVVGHGEREAVELFDLTGVGDAATMSWIGCVPLPPDTMGNDVTVGVDAELIVSNYMAAMTGWRGFYYTLASGLGSNTGDVIAWRRGEGWRHLPNTQAPAPNGVLVWPGTATVIYSETGSGLVRFAMLGSGAADAIGSKHVTIGGNPDNLSLAPGGKIFVATHTDGAAFLLCAFGRLPCRTGWSLFEVDPIDLKAKLLLHHDGKVVGAVASAAEFAGKVYMGAVFDDRIGVWQRRRVAAAAQ